MSTFVGHSLLHALHSRHRSSTSWTRGSVNPWKPSWPVIANRSRLARPRVLSFSSRVAWNEGHIVPSRFFRQAPTPAHISAAGSRPPSALKSKVVATLGVT